MPVRPVGRGAANQENDGAKITGVDSMNPRLLAGVIHAERPDSHGNELVGIVVVELILHYNFRKSTKLPDIGQNRKNY